MRGGTAKHSLVEMALDGLPLPPTITVDGETFTVDEEWREQVQVCVDFAESLRETCDIFAVEEFVNLDWFYAPEPTPVPFSGHIDMWGYNSRTNTLTVADNKFGRKIVSPDGPQNRAYAAMLLGKFGSNLPAKVRLVIIQPTNVENPISHQTLLVSELLDWATKDLDPALRRIAAGDQTEVPGEEQCMYCRRAGECRALQARALEVAQDAFDDMPVSAGNLTDDELAHILTRVDTVEHWIRQVRAEAAARIERGGVVPGFKLVEKRSNRKWSDLDSVRDAIMQPAFRDVPPIDLFTPAELRSPAQLEKACKKNGVDFKLLTPFIVREPAGTTLVPASDKRDAVDGIPIFELFTN
jgi:hypothetical protein